MKTKLLTLSVALCLSINTLSAKTKLEEATEKLKHATEVIDAVVGNTFISVKSKYNFTFEPVDGFKLPSEGSNSDHQNNPMNLKFINKSIVKDENTQLMWASRTLLISTTLPKAQEYCANLRTGDYDDWRVPTIKELVTVADYNAFEPTFSRKYFPGVPLISDYWAVARKAVGHPLHGWHVGYDGHIMGQPADGKKLTRCVRADKQQGYDKNIFIDNKNGTVTDKVTKLVWQQTMSKKKRQYKDAIKYCKELKFAGRDDWRVPHLKELTSIMDYTNMRPSMDTNFFPQTKRQEFQDFVWSSTLDPAWGTDSFSGKRFAEAGIPFAWAAEGIAGGAWKYWVTEEFLTRCVTDEK